MWLCNVVDTSISEDRECLEFWYTDMDYRITAASSIHKGRKRSFKDWLDENTRYNCIYVPKPTKENQL